MKMNAYVNFAGSCVEAFRYYEKHLGAKIGMMMTHAQSPEQGRADIPNAEPMRSAYLTLEMDSDTDAEPVFSALSDGGQVLMPIQKTFFASRFGQVRDRFGSNWMILHERPISPRA
jgi:PhnB protein